MKGIDSPRKTRVCIYGEQIADALHGNVIGGAELQAALLARSLAATGWSVTVVDPRAHADAATVEGIAIRSVPGWFGGIRGIRVLTHRIPDLVRICLSVKPAVYYVRGFSFLFMVLLVLARLTGALFFLAVASDLDLTGFRRRYASFYRKNTSLWRWISEIIPNHLTARIILGCADGVFYQHEAQEALLRRPGILLPNIVGEDVSRISPSASRENVLMVGLLASQKGIRELIPVIRRLPGITFEFIGAPSGQDGENIREELRQCPNVVLHGQLRRADTLERIAGAKVLLNVSPAEGFPNTFLEAWALGTPVVSLSVDPAGVISRYGLGFVCGGDMEVLFRLLRSGVFTVDPARLSGYVRDHHSMVAAARLFAAAAQEAGYKRGLEKEAIAI